MPSIAPHSVCRGGAPVVVCLVALIASVGCSERRFGAEVSGYVTLDGEGVGPGMVTFAPEESDAIPATGQIELNGAYFLKTNHEVGLEPGAYRVAVQAFEPPEGLAPGERRFEPSKPLVPSKYMRVRTSGLQFDVEPGRNSIDIPLSSE